MIAVDAMGGDFAPHEIVHGSVLAAQQGIAIQLYGDEEQIIDCLNKVTPHWQNLPLSIVHCSQIVTMDDEPTLAVRKKDSSLINAITSVAAGHTKAVVSAGNTGACLVAGIVALGKVAGLMRPAVGDFLPTKQGSVFCIDLGANVDCKPEHLVQFAILGDAFVRLTKNIDRPRVALLSNGAERTKGNKIGLETFTLLEQSGLNFIGNNEPTAILEGQADVVVCDGFAGNIMLKAFEAMAVTIPSWLRAEYNRSLFNRCLGFLSAKLFKRVKKRLYAHKGGALLLGLNHPFIVAHGSSNAETIKDAIVYAHTIVQQKIVTSFNNLVEQTLAVHEHKHRFVAKNVYSHVSP